ncbi:hypothetical protein CJF42_26065, partial [Pseudoalteromonas sp. NBT06-2]|uniref:response regulator n=1 Tax=Pseudoalteromonas sp. NBT06-2 TaxID=2025950 RepID=UPI000BD3D714
AKFQLQKGLPLTRRKIALPELEGLNVLVVDDNATAKEIMLDMLKSFNFNTIAASSGSEAFNLIEQNQVVDLIFIDWQMPKLDGIETARIIKQKRAHVPIILMTAYDREEAIQQAKNVSFSTILAKPFSSSALMDVIMASLSHQVVGRREVNKVNHEIENAQKLKGAKILLVEDNELNQELVFELLSDVGIIVKVA